MKLLDFEETVREDLRRDPAFARDYHREAVEALRGGEADVAAVMLGNIEAAGVLSFRSRRAPSRDLAEA